MFRSYRAIAKDEEITISYIDRTQGLQKRKEMLFETYLFDCKCKKCEKGAKGEGELSTGNPLLDERIDNAKSQLQALVVLIMTGQQSLDSIERTVLEICRDGYPGKAWPSTVQPIPTINTFLALMFQKQGSWRKALYYWLKVCYVIDPIRFPDRLDPTRLENLALLATLEGYV